ncbi:hypothetical protein GGS23DRAFT_595504 [Durotheca rogersii]|uniref:uncharacterized protein n=1 Tax=Durotheca rogersii TaxID=419775 RepID=UPI00221E3A3D|nr:uncharacterized protein GGS23DRAFT_595504 [Durotheca rogersii]KAI5864808.1 hypothetical protein GGS23DRAFT_595504 [Durotheca rogersii]
MALVDYSSSDSEPEAGGQDATPPAGPAAKRRKTCHYSDADALPPLPAAFHDLYASTVRVSVADDPALHQGRRRVNPHKAGSWPSHLYIEWHPTAAQLATLGALLAALRPALGLPLTSFLTSELGAPQPLHVSLSRPIALATAHKDAFLERLRARVQRAAPPFDLAPVALAWHRARDSERSFLVLRVASASSSSSSPLSSSSSFSFSSSSSSPPPKNPELARLLRHCNALVAEFQQPPLYAGADADADAPDDAFHVSIAWSFAAPTPEVRRRTQEVFAAPAEAAAAAVSPLRDAVLAMRVPVRGLKAKIGNVVTHIALPAPGAASAGSAGSAAAAAVVVGGAGDGGRLLLGG